MRDFKRILRKLSADVAALQGRIWRSHVKNLNEEWEYWQFELTSKSMHETTFVEQFCELLDIAGQPIAIIPIDLIESVTGCSQTDKLDSAICTRMQQVIWSTDNVITYTEFLQANEIRSQKHNLEKYSHLVKGSLKTVKTNGASRVHFVALSLDRLFRCVASNTEKWREQFDSISPSLLQTIELPTSWNLGEVCITSEQCLALQKGQILLLGINTDKAHKELRINCAGLLLSIKQITNNVGSLEVAEMQNEKNDGLESYRLSNEERVDTKNVNVRVGVSVGSISLSLEELQKLSDGKIVSLRKPVSSDVVLDVNGQYIGTGELIDIEGVLAVEIKELN